MHARRGGYGLALARLGIVYGPSPVEHDAPESQTVIDKFRRLAAAGDRADARRRRHGDDRRVHVADAARLLLDCEVPAPGGVASLNVAAETLTVADVAALARGPRAGRRRRPGPSRPPFEYEHSVADYLARVAPA